MVHIIDVEGAPGLKGPPNLGYTSVGYRLVPPHIKELSTVNARRVNLRIPGPTPCPPEVLEAMRTQMVNHRGPEFKQLLVEATDGLKEFYETKGEIFILTGSGTVGLEAAVVNFLSPGDRTLNVVIGNFGTRFLQICRTFGADAVELAFGNGTAADPEQVRQALKDDPSIKAVFITHNETSTGITNPLQELAAVVKEQGKLLIVDGVSSVSSIPCRVDEWGLDVVVSGSQKGWMIPPGLSFISVSDDGWKAHEKAKMPRFANDLTRAKKSLSKGETPWTSPISLFFALEACLKLLRAEGRENVFTRHAEIGQKVRDGVRAMGLSLLAEDERFASNTVTAVTMPEGQDPDVFRKKMDKDYDVILQGGQADLTGKIFRIGHMGWVSEADIDEVFVAMRTALPEVGMTLQTTV